LNNPAAPNAPGIMVSVAMITYNHEAFIAQAIEGVLMQQTDFTVELIIGEDCSTDGTRAIVQRFKDKFPDRINLQINERNMGMIPNFIVTFEKCRGQYIALCEGDDYWTDPLKLQKQVDFMETHPDYIACFHRTYRLEQATGEMGVWKQMPRTNKKTYTLNDVVRGGFFATATVMLRNGVVPNLPNWYIDCQVGDWPLLILYAQHGKIGFINQTMSTFRVHSDSVTNSVNIIKKHEMFFNTIETVGKYLGPDYERLIYVNIAGVYNGLASYCADNNDFNKAKSFLLEGIIKYPYVTIYQGIDRLVLLGRLYAPHVYKMAKIAQKYLN
jgi:glycosyltransferase involved in cell wall biosynthesis